MIRGMENLLNKERLSRLGLLGLGKDNGREVDMTEVYKIMTDLEKVHGDLLFLEILELGDMQLDY